MKLLNALAAGIVVLVIAACFLMLEAAPLIVAILFVWWVIQ